MEKALRELTLNCKFCGSTTKETCETYADDDLVLDVISCKQCFPSDRKGTKVKYGAASRAPGDAVYADYHLKRDEVYMVAKVKRWQHGSYVELVETPGKEYNFALFTPEGFVKEERDATERD